MFGNKLGRIPPSVMWLVGLLTGHPINCGGEIGTKLWNGLDNPKIRSVY
jgi:hypothetical protein